MRTQVTLNIRKTNVLRLTAVLVIIMYFAISGYPQGVWKGGTTDWNSASNWDDNQVPTLSVDVTIPTHPASGDNYPVINADANCKNLTIQSLASVTVNSGKTLNVAGNFVIQSNASGTGALLDNGTINISGTATVKRYISGVTGYHYITTVIDEAPLSQIHSTVPLKNLGFGYYNPLNMPGANQMPNIWKLDETHSTSDPAALEAWLAPTSVAEPMEEMRGYALNTPSGVTLSFSGAGSSLNTGSKSINVTKTGPGGGAYGDGGNGWNLVGNPYPSPLDWNAIAAGLPAGVSHTVAFYYPSTQWSGGFGYYHPIAGPSGAYPHNRYIPSSQSFYLNTNANATVTFNNSYRTVAPAAMGTAFYKKTEKGGNTNPIVRLSGVFKGQNTGYKDETVVFFNPIATTTFNYKTDAQKFMNTEPTIPNIYTVKDNMNLAINGLPEITNNMVIPIGFEVQLDGEYSINANEIANIDPSSVNVYLEDLAKNVSQDLFANPNYTFKVNPADKGGRFFLRFTLASTGVESFNTKTDLCYAYASAKTLFINYNSSLGGKCDVYVTNLQGQNVFEVNQLSSGQHTYELNQAPGCYVVKIVSSNNVSVQKVYIY